MTAVTVFLPVFGFPTIIMSLGPFSVVLLCEKEWPQGRTQSYVHRGPATRGSRRLFESPERFRFPAWHSRQRRSCKTPRLVCGVRGGGAGTYPTDRRCLRRCG